MSEKRCRFDKRILCLHSSGSCDFIDDLGFVSVCSLYRGGDKLRSRKACSSPVSVFELWNGRVERRGRSR